MNSRKLAAVLDVAARRRIRWPDTPVLAPGTVARYWAARTRAQRRIRMVVVDYANGVYHLRDQEFPELSIWAQRWEIEPTGQRAALPVPSQR